MDERPTCTHCGLNAREHLAYYDVPDDGGDLERSCFDPTDGYWEGLYCPPGDSGRIAEALGADIVEPVKDAVARGAIPHDQRCDGSKDTGAAHEKGRAIHEGAVQCATVSVIERWALFRSPVYGRTELVRSEVQAIVECAVREYLKYLTALNDSRNDQQP